MPAAILALLCAWHLGLRWRGMALPRISDEGGYAYEAVLLEEGGVPYRDAYDQKPPLIYFIYRLSHLLFGRTAQAPRWLAAAGCWLAMILLYRLTPATWAMGARLAAPAAFATLTTLPVGDLGFVANTEVFVALFTTISVSLAWEGGSSLRSIVLAGLAAGCAVMTKQTAMWSVVLIAAIAVRSLSPLRQGLERLAAFAAGVGAVPAACLAYFALRGAAGDFIDQAFLRNFDYANFVLQSGAGWEQVGWVLGVLMPACLRGAWPAALLAVVGLVLALSQGDRDRRIGILAASWLAAAAAGVAVGLWFFPHYLVVLAPPLSLACALGVQRVSGGRAAVGMALAAVVALYPAAANASAYFRDSPQELARRLMFPNPLFESMELAGQLRANSKAGDSIYVFGSEPQIYVYAGRRAATRHMYIYPLTLFPRSAADVERELAELEAAGPRHIVYVNIAASTLIASRPGARLRQGVVDLLSRRYRWVGTVELHPVDSKYAFWFGEERGGHPDWAAEDRLYVFEAR